MIYDHSGISGNQLRIPKLLAMTQSADISNRNAKTKLIMMVVKVKNKLGMA